MPTYSRPSWSVAVGPTRAVTRSRMRSLSSRGGLLGERERDDRLRRLAVREQRRDSLRHDLGLARAGGGDDLDVAAAVRDGRGRLSLELRDFRSRRLGTARRVTGTSASSEVDVAGCAGFTDSGASAGTRPSVLEV